MQSLLGKNASGGVPIGITREIHPKAELLNPHPRSWSFQGFLFSTFLKINVFFDQKIKSFPFHIN